MAIIGGIPIFRHTHMKGVFQRCQDDTPFTAAHPETSAKTVSLRNGLSATIHSLKFTKTCHERNLTCTKKHVLPMFYHDSTWKLYKTGWPDHAKDEWHTGRVPELRFLSSSGAAAVQQRWDPAVQQRLRHVASKPLPGRASQPWGWAPSRPSRHGTMHWRTAEGFRGIPRAFTMFYHAFPPTPLKEIDMKSHAKVWMVYASWYLIIVVVLQHHFITWYYITTSIYIYI